MSDLEQRLERLESIEGVRELMWRYATAVDEMNEVGDLADLFTEDAVLRTRVTDRVGSFEGREAILAYYGYVLGPTHRRRHHILNSTVEVLRRGRARHRAYFVAILESEDSRVAVMGDYDDDVVRAPDGRWRFTEKGNRAVGTIELAVPAPAER